MTPAVQSGTASRPPVRTTRRSFARSSLCGSPSLSLKIAERDLRRLLAGTDSPGGRGRGHRGGPPRSSSGRLPGRAAPEPAPGRRRGGDHAPPVGHDRQHHGRHPDRAEAGRSQLRAGLNLLSVLLAAAAPPSTPGCCGSGPRPPSAHPARFERPRWRDRTCGGPPPPPAGGRVAGPGARLPRGEVGRALGLGGCTAPPGGTGVSSGPSCDRRRGGGNSREVDAEEPGPARRQAERTGPTGPCSG